MLETWNQIRPSSSFPCAPRARRSIEPILQTLVSVSATAPDDHGARGRRPLARAAGAADRGRVRRARVRLRPPGGRRRPSRRHQRRPDRRRSSTAWTSAWSLPACVLESTGWLDRLQRAHRHRRQPRRRRRWRVLEADGTIRQAGYFFSLFRRAWSARLRPRARRSCWTSTTRCCARSAPSWSSSAASGSRRSAASTSCSTARTRRWTTACASRRGRRVRPRADRPRPRADDGRRRARRRRTLGRARLRLKHAGVNFQRWSPEVV